MEFYILLDCKDRQGSEFCLRPYQWINVLAQFCKGEQDGIKLVIFIACYQKENCLFRKNGKKISKSSGKCGNFFHAMVCVIKIAA